MATTWKALRRMMDRDLVLDRLGLERRTPGGDFFTGLGLFSIGVLVGAGLGLMLAPKRGDEMRSALNEAWRKRGRRSQDFQHDLGVEGGMPAAPTAGGH
jgi:gas vesicle protein